MEGGGKREGEGERGVRKGGEGDGGGRRRSRMCWRRGGIAELKDENKEGGRRRGKEEGGGEDEVVDKCVRKEDER